MAVNGTSDGGEPSGPVPAGHGVPAAPAADTLIVYPSPFPIKVMGPAAPGFVPAVLAVVQRHAPDFDPATIETRSSREGKYTSLTATVVATSREQLDALYRDLCDHPMVVMVL